MLTLEHISYFVDDEAGSREILHDVSLTIPESACIVVTGPNGGGKSTLAKVIAGIYRPDEGKIFLDGQDITDLTITQRAKAGISFAFQQPVRFKGLTVRDMINLSAGKHLDTNQACAYLSEVGLCAVDYIDRELNASLSGGELKRIEIAMVIARGTRVALFDEPEAGIDLWSFNNLIRVFTEMKAKQRGAIMIISHQERILEIADQIVVVSGGEVTATGTKEEILPDLLRESDACRFYRGGVAR